MIKARGKISPEMDPRYWLGYRNARCGRIEAHEAVTACGRKKLLRAKELAEAAGLRLLQALTDSLWQTRPDLGL